jgi:3-deoxy-D-manno-octulosonic-acid transferase
MGELADLYRYGTVAFVGGTFGKWGGHSLIEPLSAGRFTLHGPYVRNFRTVAREAAAAGAAREVGDADQLLAVLTELLEYEMMLREAGQKAAMYAATQAGSAERQSRVLMNLIT